MTNERKLYDINQQLMVSKNQDERNKLIAQKDKLEKSEQLRINRLAKKIMDANAKKQALMANPYGRTR